jgi:hypothetical protein
MFLSLESTFSAEIDTNRGTNARPFATIRPELQNHNDYWLTDGFRSGRACVLPNEDGEQLSVMAAGNKSVR